MYQKFDLNCLLKGRKGKEDGWQGDYIEVIFDNKTKLHCDLSSYGMIQKGKVHIEKNCNLEMAGK